jgi:hypothetical protein
LPLPSFCKLEIVPLALVKFNLVIAVFRELTLLVGALVGEFIALGI